MSTILERVEDWLRDFRPRTHRQFVALQICRRFDDLPNLARYLQGAERHPKKVLLEAARLAGQRGPDDGPAAKVFFELLDQFEKEAA